MHKKLHQPILKLYFLSVILLSTSVLDASAKKINLRVQGLPFFFLDIADSPLFHIEAMLRPHKNFNLGVIASMHRIRNSPSNKTYEFDSYELGGRFDFVFAEDAFSSGVYLSNSFMLGKFSSKELTYFPTESCHASYTSSGWSTLNSGSIGYQHFWSNGYNLNAGIGYSIAMPFTSDPKIANACQGTDVKEFDHGDYRKLYLDVGFGFAF